MSPWQRPLHPLRTPHAQLPQLPILARSFLMLAVIGPLALAGCSTALVREDVEAYASLPTHRHLAPRKVRALLASPAPPNCDYKGPDGDGIVLQFAPQQGEGLIAQARKLFRGDPDLARQHAGAGGAADGDGDERQLPLGRLWTVVLRHDYQLHGPADSVAAKADPR